MNLNIAVTSYPGGDGSCIPASVIRGLWNSDRLPLFRAANAAPEDRGLGNCHEIAVALIVDPYAAGQDGGWRWCRGISRINGDHSWVEHAAVAAKPADLGAQPVVPRTGPAPRRADAQDDHRRPSAQAPYCTVAVHHRRRRHRGSRDEGGTGDDLTPSART